MSPRNVAAVADMASRPKSVGARFRVENIVKTKPADSFQAWDPPVTRMLVTARDLLSLSNELTPAISNSPCAVLRRPGGQGRTSDQIREFGAPCRPHGGLSVPRAGAAPWMN